MIYLFTIITIILLIMLVGGKENNMLTGENKYSNAFIASLIVTAVVYIAIR